MYCRAQNAAASVASVALRLRWNIPPHASDGQMGAILFSLIVAGVCNASFMK